MINKSMAIIPVEHFYDQQQVRFLAQIVRAFSGFQYMAGSRAGQPPSLKMVPCTMAQTDLMVANILKNQSENTLLTVPMITVYQDGLSFNNEMMQNPNHIDTRQVTERAEDDQGNLLHGRGRSYTVRRYMPRPFNMTITVDLWTSNQDQKYQLTEQILPRILPSFDIQNSENALDWTAKTTAYIEDITWTSKSIPVGTESQIDIFTIKIRLPMHISPPAEVTEQKLIEQVNANIYSGSDVPISGTILDGDAHLDIISKSIISPGNHWIRVEGDRITLLANNGSTEVDASGNPFSWKTLIDQYGVLYPTLSRIILKTDPDSDVGIVGTIQYDPNNVNVLFLQIDPDTLPTNTMQPVNAIVNPLSKNPISGLPPATMGQRYLLVNELGANTEGWGSISAKYGDIIEYNGTQWVTTFQAELNGTSIQYVYNISNGSQLRWGDGDWTLAIDGEYPNGNWRFML